MTLARQAPPSVGILQARILEWVAVPSSRGSSQLRDQTQVSHTAGRFFTVWAAREANACALSAGSRVESENVSPVVLADSLQLHGP